MSGAVYFVAWLVNGFRVDFSFIFFSGVFNYWVHSVAWLAAVIVSAVMVARRGGRLVRLLLVASCLMLIATLVSFPVASPLMKAWIQQGDPYAPSFIAGVLGNVWSYTVIGGWLALAGIICFIRLSWTGLSDNGNKINA
ncbi:hypothetical protein ACFLVH_04040 [Chloroflexota bacterium]